MPAVDELGALLLGCGCRRRCCAPAEHGRPAGQGSALFQQAGRADPAPRPQEDTPFIPPAPLDLAPLPLPGVGMFLGVGAGEIRSYARATGDRAGFVFRQDADALALATIRAQPDVPYPTAATDTPNSGMEADLIGSTVAGALILLLYGASWRSVTLPAYPGAPVYTVHAPLPLYVLITVDPATSTATLIDVARAPEPVSPLQPFPNDPTPYGNDAWEAFGPAYSRISQLYPLSTTEGAYRPAGRHVAVVTQPGRIRALGYVQYANRLFDQPGEQLPNGRQAWTGTVEVVADVGSLTVTLTRDARFVDRSGDGADWLTAGQLTRATFSGETPDGTLMWLVDRVTTAAACRWTGTRSEVVATAAAPSADLLAQTTALVPSEAARHGHAPDGARWRVRQAAGLGGGVIDLSAGTWTPDPDRLIYPGWPLSPVVQGRVPVTRAPPGTITSPRDLRTVRGPVRTRMTGGDALRAGDRVAGVPVSGASTTAVTWPGNPSPLLAGVPTDITPNTTASWDGHLAPVELPALDWSWLPVAPLLPLTVAGWTPATQAFPPGNWDLPAATLRVARLRSPRVDGVPVSPPPPLVVTWPQATADDTRRAYHLVLIVRVRREATLSAQITGDDWRWATTGNDHLITIPPRRWVQVRSLLLPAQNGMRRGPPDTTIHLSQPAEIALIALERLGPP